LNGESSPEQAEANRAVLRVDAGPLAAPLLGRVVAMMLARADCPVDRLDDAMLLCDAIAAHAPDHASDGRMQFVVSTDAEGLELRVGALAAQGARQLVEAAVLPGVGNVLEPIADELRIESDANGEEELVLELSFGRAGDQSDAQPA
jgi:serine/threonine-protein kinase RsbW